MELMEIQYHPPVPIANAHPHHHPHYYLILINPCHLQCCHLLFELPSYIILLLWATRDLLWHLNSLQILLKVVHWEIEWTIILDY